MSALHIKSVVLVVALAVLGGCAPFGIAASVGFIAIKRLKALKPA